MQDEVNAKVIALVIKGGISKEITILFRGA